MLQLTAASSPDAHKASPFTTPLRAALFASGNTIPRDFCRDERPSLSHAAHRAPIAARSVSIRIHQVASWIVTNKSVGLEGTFKGLLVQRPATSRDTYSSIRAQGPSSPTRSVCSASNASPGNPCHCPTVTTPLSRRKCRSKAFSMSSYALPPSRKQRFKPLQKHLPGGRLRKPLGSRYGQPRSLPEQHYGRLPPLCPPARNGPLGPRLCRALRPHRAPAGRAGKPRGTHQAHTPSAHTTRTHNAQPPARPHARLHIPACCRAPRGPTPPQRRRLPEGRSGLFPPSITPPRPRPRSSATEGALRAPLPRGSEPSGCRLTAAVARLCMAPLPPGRAQEPAAIETAPRGAPGRGRGLDGGGRGARARKERRGAGRCVTAPARRREGKGRERRSGACARAGRAGKGAAALT